MRTLGKMSFVVGVAGISSLLVANCVDANTANECWMTASCTPPCVDAGTCLDGSSDGNVEGGGGADGSPTESCVPSKSSPAVDDGCGVFVSNDQGDDTTGKGTKEAPFKTIGAALKRGTTLYVCAANTAYAEALVLNAKTTLYGGLDCASWKYDAAKKTKLTAAADAVPLSSSAAGSAVYDFAITAADASVAGGSSIAVVVSGGSLALTNADLTAGKAMAGAAGTTVTGAAPSGTTGDSGSAVCSGVTTGAVGKTNTCPTGGSSTAGNGGNGGFLDADGGLAAAGRGTDGRPVNPSYPTSGAGGAGEGQPGSTPFCVAGLGGAPGAAGDSGPGATSVGTLNASGYVGGKGVDGGNGQPGQGGGGGGGAKGATGVTCGTVATTVVGATGGAGGTGGCGGTGGGGGQAGGSSIAVVSVGGATVTLTNVNLTAGLAGAGGKGGDGQNPGQPGAGGAFGAGDSAGLTNPSCAGGAGGRGGAGGPGGGGQGGHSLGIAVSGRAAPVGGTFTIVPTNAGKGGLGGAKNATANAGTGADGIAANCWDFDKNQSCGQ